MLARSAKQDGKYRKIVTVLTTLVLAMSGLALSPAHATVIPSNGTYLCTSGEASDLTPNFTITNGVVTTGASCAGAVVIPEGVTSIGYQAFMYSGLDSIKIPASITTIQQEAFSFTNSLTSITVDGANPNYSSADGVLFNKDSSTLINYPAGKTGTSYTIPASVTTIGDGAFVVATSLGSITVPASVTSIGTSAFYNATALTTVTFESGSQLTTIGIYAFDSASALTSITIPASVTSIGEWAFANATKLASVYFLGNAPTSVGNMPFLNVADGAKAIVRAADTSYLVDADNKWNGLIVELDYTLTDGFYLCSTGVLTTTGTPTYRVLDGEVSSGGSCAGAVVIPEGVTSIGTDAFNGATALTSITIPASVTTIGTSAFYNATELTTVTFESGSKLTSIGTDAFARATALTSITIPASVTSIGTSAFYNATALTTVTFESGSQLTTISGYLFGLATALEGITIPASVETIGNFAFYNATALTTVTFESGSQLTTIEQGAFVGATLLTSITIPASVTSIGDYAFNGATTLTSFYFLGNAPTSVGMMPFWNVADGAKAIVRAGATGFGDEASWNGLAVIVEPLADGFYLCSTGVLTTTGTPTYRILDGEVSSGYSCAGAVVIPEGVTTIGSEAFAGESAITSITIPAGVTTIGSAAFAAASALTSITVDGANPNYSSTDGVLFNKDSSTLIAYPAGKTGTSYTIPAGVTTIGFLGFYGATSLTSFYFLGNAPDTDDSFYDFADGTKAYIKSGATGFGDTDSWGGLVVTIGVYTVTYNTSGGSVVTAQDYFANFPTPTSPTRTGYTFAGWSATAGGSVIAWPHTPASGSDITLYAKWTRDLAKAVATVKPSVSGTAKVSKVLAAKKGTWTGYPTPAITYQWYSCSKTVATVKAIVPNTCKKISGATKSTLKLAKAQKGKFIAVLVSGNSAGTSATTWLSKSTTKVS